MAHRSTELLAASWLVLLPSSWQGTERFRTFRGSATLANTKCPVALESYRHMEASAQNFLKSLGDMAAGRGNISKYPFVESAYKEVSCS